MAKFGFRASDVWQMSLLEVSAWIASYLQMQGIKSPSPTQAEKTTRYTIIRKSKTLGA